MSKTKRHRLTNLPEPKKEDQTIQLAGTPVGGSPPEEPLKQDTFSSGEPAAMSQALLEYEQTLKLERDRAELVRLKEQKLQALENQSQELIGLQHRYGRKMYKWQREFFDCMEKDAFLTAANQVGKSTVQIGQCIEWAGNKSLWQRLWGSKLPRVFWYLYPSMELATVEVESKWIPDLLPKGSMKDDPTWGWKATYMGPHIRSIEFNSGVTIYFKAYTQNIMNLQAATVSAIFCFPENTMIETPFGPRPIYQLKQGDLVNTHKGVQPVRNVMVAAKPIYIRDITGQKEPMRATGDHPFYTVNRGWVWFSKLQRGDVLITKTLPLFLVAFFMWIGKWLTPRNKPGRKIRWDKAISWPLKILTKCPYIGKVLSYLGIATIVSDTVVEPNDESKTVVYNLEVEKDHTFYANGILVHNCDEELVEEFWDEINFRRMAMNGYFRMVFTATLGQKLWHDTMERRGEKEEKFPAAWKKQVSLFDCMEFEDGTPSHITDEYIKRAISLCKSEAEVQKRVYGRFATDSGLKYGSFDRKDNSCPAFPIPDDWQYYIGVDVGSGGNSMVEHKQNHPAAIQVCAVDPTFTKARCVEAWYGNEEQTTSMDVYEKLVEILDKGGYQNKNLSAILYDYHAKDFSIICQRNGLSVEKAEKLHSVGESVLNVLFKNKALKIFDVPSHDELFFELSNLKKSTNKRKARDDATDALRYALTRVPFDWAKLGISKPYQDPLPVPDPTQYERQNQDRRAGLKALEAGFQGQNFDVDDELAAWQETYDI